MEWAAGEEVMVRGTIGGGAEGWQSEICTVLEDTGAELAVSYGACIANRLGHLPSAAVPIASTRAVFSGKVKRGS